MFDQLNPWDVSAILIILGVMTFIVTVWLAVLSWVLEKTYNALDYLWKEFRARHQSEQ